MCVCVCLNTYAARIKLNASIVRMNVILRGFTKIIIHQDFARTARQSLAELLQYASEICRSTFVSSSDLSSSNVLFEPGLTSLHVSEHANYSSRRPIHNL
jgi:hypothetical protein